MAKRKDNARRNRRMNEYADNYGWPMHRGWWRHNRMFKGLLIGRHG